MDATITFEQVVETVRQCSLEQMKVLSDLMRRWEIEAVRREIAEEAKKIAGDVPARKSSAAIGAGSD